MRDYTERKRVLRFLAKTTVNMTSPIRYVTIDAKPLQGMINFEGVPLLSLLAGNYLYDRTHPCWPAYLTLTEFVASVITHASIL